MTTTTTRHHIIRTLVFLSSLTLAHGLFNNFRNDGFSENVLQTLTNFDVDAVGHSIVRLQDGSVIITGIVRYPPGMRNHSSFQDEADVLQYDNTTDVERYAGIVIRVHNNGTRAWAKRTALCTVDTTFTSVVDGEHVYVAGASIGTTNGVGTPQCCEYAAGMVLLRYNINGTQEALMVHGEDGERYTSISLTPAEGDTLFLTSCTPSGLGPYRDTDPERWPVDNGLSVSRVRKRDMVAVQQQVITNAQDGTLTGQLMKDDFWDMKVAHDGSAIFITANREVLRFGYSKFPSLFTISGNNLSVIYTRLFENELQVDTRLATSQVSDGVFMSYVDRRANKEILVVRHLQKNLSDVYKGEKLDTISYRITLETEFLKEIRSTVKSLKVDNDRTTRVLLHSAEVVNRTLVPPGVSPPASFEQHRQLTNGRPAVVVMTPGRGVGYIVQAQTAQQWEPRDMIVGEREHVITGSDRGLLFDGNAKVLLTGVERVLLPSPSPTPSKAANVDASPTPSRSPTSGSIPDCVGVSTRIDGDGIAELVRRDARLRMQIHPRRLGARAEVLCYGWRNGTEGMLCATGTHVVRHWGKPMYMRELCEVVDCETRVERVVNFKGACGDEMNVHEGLSVTMHAGGGSAAQAVTEECRLMRRMKLWWWITTL